MQIQESGIAMRTPAPVVPRTETWRFVVVCVAFLVGMFGVFVLPWFVPVSSVPVDAESWSAGFNNTVAVAAALAAALAIAAAGFPGARASVRIFAAPAERTRVAWWAVALASVAFVFQGVVLALSGAVVGDAAFHLDRAANVLAGGRLFVDVEYPYGPGLLNAVIAAGRLATGAGFLPRVGYYALFTLVMVASMLVLALVLGRLDMSRGLKTALFAMFALLLWAFEGQYAGIQFGFVRYLGALAALAVLREIVRTERGTGGLEIAWRTVAAAGLAAVVLAISPDAGIAYALAGFVVLIPLTVGAARRWALVAGHAAGVALPFVLLGPALLRSLALFGGGFGLFPVLPGPTTLLLLGALWYVAWETGPLARVPERIDRAFTWGVLLAIVALLPSALGRADFSHVLFAGTGLVLVAAALLSQRSRRSARLAVTMTAAVVALVLVANAWWFFVQPAWQTIIAAQRAGWLSQDSARTSLVALGVTDEEAAVFASEIASGAPVADPWPPTTVGRMFAPLGFVDDYGWVLAANGSLAPDFYRRLQNLGTDEQWQGLRARILASDLLIVPTSRYHAGPQPAMALSLLETWRLYQLPIAIDFRRPRLTHEKDLFDALAGYAPVERIAVYTVLRRR